MGERMLAGFALYREPTFVPSVIGTPLGTRLKQIVRLPRGWRLWTATADFVYGSYLELDNSGMITNVTTRQDEGDDTFISRPADSDVLPRTR